MHSVAIRWLPPCRAEMVTNTQPMPIPKSAFRQNCSDERCTSRTSRRVTATVMLAIWGRETDYGRYTLPYDAVRVAIERDHLVRGGPESVDLACERRAHRVEVVLAHEKNRRLHRRGQDHAARRGIAARAAGRDSAVRFACWP